MERETAEDVAPLDQAQLPHLIVTLKWFLMLYTTQEQFNCGEDKDMEKEVDWFMENGGLLSLLLGAAARWYPEHDKKRLVFNTVTELLSKALNSLSYLDREVVSDFVSASEWREKKQEYEMQWRERSLEVCRFIAQIKGLIKQEAKEIFQMPKSLLSNNLMTHQVLGVFIDFLRSCFDELLQSRNEVSQEMEPIVAHIVSFLKKKTQSISSEMERMEEVREGLCFLLTFLGDEPLHHNKFEKVKELYVNIEFLTNKTGEFCYMIFLDKTEDAFSQALSELLQNIELTVKDIKEFVNTFQPRVSKIYRSDDFVMGFASSILERLQELLDYRTELIHPLKNEIEMVVKELMSLESFTMTFNKGLSKNEEDLRNLSLRVSGIIDVAEYLISCFEVQVSPLWYYHIRLSHILEEINFLKMKMNDINEINNCDDEPLEDTAESSDGKSSQFDNSVPTRVMADHVCETNIRSQLLGGEQKLELISIVGMPGLGKTTLAKKLCNDPAILKKFYPCGWCRVTRAYNYKNLLLGILASMSKLDDKMKKMSEGDLAEYLYRNLKGSRYLIVLDDIWNTNPWEDCQLCFPDDGSGSRIVFMSRREDLQLQGKPHTTYKLPFLSLDDSWHLLKYNVFQDGQCPAGFEKVGKIIAERCQGLPLAINLIAGLLQIKERELRLWEEVSRTSGAYISGDLNLGEMILEDIYKHLPHSLKICMMYCAGFREQNEIRVQKLMRLWIAEGLIQKPIQGSLEKAAEICLTDMINRSLVIVVDRSANGRIKTCILHSWLHDFFLRKAQEENFLKVMDGPFSTYECHHRLVLVDPICTNLLGVRPFGPHVRSLLCLFSPQPGSITSHASYVFNGLKLLNVLDLESAELLSVPSDISRLILLKYLALRGHFESIPSSIGSLWNLETLIVKAPLTCLPDAILGMSKLKHLLIKSKEATLESLYDHKASKLHTVQTLGTVYIQSRNDTEVLRCFQNLRAMKCRFAEIQIASNNSKYCFPALDFLHHLEILHVFSLWESWRSRKNKAATLSFPPSLKQLTLSKLRLPWNQISMLAESLPKLEVLKLVDNAFEGKECDMDIDEVEFPELKFLKLRGLGMQNWNLSSSADAFPKLERLVIKYCKNLKKIPSSFAENTELCLIDLQGCSNSAEDSAFQIMEEQHDYGNDKFEVLIRLGD